MDVYAHALAQATAQELGVDCVDSYIPRSLLERFSGNKQVMRYLRYVRYPQMIPRIDTDIHHVVDHGYAHLLPKLRGGVRCITVHDLIPLLDWRGELSFFENEGRRMPSRKPRLHIHSNSFLSKYDAIIADSQSTARDLDRFLGIDYKSISVIPPIISSTFRPFDKMSKGEFSKRHKLSEDCHWILISGAEAYKNHAVSLRVLAQLIRVQKVKVKLIKTGRVSSQFEEMVQALGLTDHVQSIYFKDHSELVELYNLVDCLLFPSVYEGFGMPVLEALACGTPVVISDRGSLPEVGGELALQNDALDVEGLTGSVMQCLSDQDLRAKVMLEGPQWAKQFDSQTVATKIVGLYSDLLYNGSLRD